MFNNIFSKLFKQTNTKLGRWKLKDNIEIKATLANMDSCGDSLCGTPKTYSNTINYILKSKTNY